MKKNMKKKFTLLVTIIATIFATAATTYSISKYKWYSHYANKHHIGIIEEYSTKALQDHEEILIKRGDKLIIERSIGECVSNNGDGIIYNADPEYNYITYRHIDGIKKGDVVLTLFIYEPGNCFTDDITCRFDFVIDSRRK